MLKARQIQLCKQEKAVDINKKRKDIITNGQDNKEGDTTVKSRVKMYQAIIDGNENKEKIRTDNYDKNTIVPTNTNLIDKKEHTGIESSSSKLRKREDDGSTMDITCVNNNKNNSQTQHQITNIIKNHKEGRDGIKTKNTRQDNVPIMDQDRKRKDDDDTNNRQHNKIRTYRIQ